jgi:phospholipid/cholesterol/gamma-HCH transport system substrate-binding protein
MENRAHAIAAGLFTLLLAAGVFITAKWLTGGTVARDVYELVSTFPVTGLNPRAVVRYRGVEVGRVESIRLNPKNQREILVRILVDSSVKLTKASYAQLGYQGVTGIAHVALEDDGSKPAELLRTSALDPARIPVRQSAFSEFTSAGQTLLANVNETTTRMNTLLGPDNQEAVSRLLANLSAAAGRVDKLAADLEPTAKALPGVVNDAELALKRADALLGRLSEKEGAIERFARSSDQVGTTSREVGAALTDQAVPRIVTLTEDLSRTARELDRLVRGLEEQPQSLLFGKPPPAPGPGEPGFVAPGGRPR